MSQFTKWAKGYDVSRETYSALKQFVDVLIEENSRQNLIGPKTVEDVWDRHVLDSAQLLDFAGAEWESWLDIGSGGGLPGLVVAIISGRRVTLVEPRKKRADFLKGCGVRLGLKVDVVPTRAQQMHSQQFDVISARAVAALPDLFAMTTHLSGPGTVYVLPKGKRGHEELASVREDWQGDFRLEPSITDPDSVIVVARNVRRRGR